MKIVFHNLQQTYSQESSLEEGDNVNWYKPFVWAGDDELIVLTHSKLQNYSDNKTKVICWQQPENEILSEVLRTVSGKVVELVYFTYTVYVQKFAEKLQTLGVRFVAPLPRLTPGQICYWNSKIGGRQFLLRQDLSEIHSYLPIAIPIFSLDDIFSLITDNRSWLLKSNLAAGGIGIIKIDKSIIENIVDIEEWISDKLSHPSSSTLPTSTKTKKIFGNSEHFLLEEYVGVPETNLTLTADFLADKSSACIGIAIAKMANVFSHAGIRWQPDSLSPAQRQKIVDIGLLIGNKLYDLGYRGYWNADFILTAENRLVICEINIRRSTPLDQFLTLNTRLGESWHQYYFVDFCEGDTLDRADKDWQKCEFDGNKGIIWLSEHPAIPKAHSPYLFVSREPITPLYMEYTS